MEEQPKAIVKTLRHEFSREIKRQYCFFFSFLDFFFNDLQGLLYFFLRRKTRDPTSETLRTLRPRRRRPVRNFNAATT